MSYESISDYLVPSGSRQELERVYVYFKFRAYLQTTLRCTKKAYIIKTSKQRSRYVAYGADELAQVADSKATEQRELPYDLDWALGQLEPAQARIIRQCYFEGASEEELAKSKNVTRQAINNQKRRALLHLRRILRENEPKS